MKNETTSKPASKSSAAQLTLIGLMAAILCILAPLTIPLPFSPVPISLTNLVLLFCVYILGWKRTLSSYLVYLALGLAGLPVFSAYTGGPGKLLGPTGGYLIGFLFLIPICGIFIEKKHSGYLICFAGMLLGTLVCNLFGSIWLSRQAHITLYQALLTGVVPFIPGDLLKILLSLFAGPQIRKRLSRTNLLSQ